MFRNIIKNTKFVFSGLDKNPYSVLGLSSSATEEEIKNAYFKLAKQYHPDIQPQYADKFKEINEAYNTLKDPTKVKQTSFREQSTKIHKERITLIPTTIKTIITQNLDSIGKISKTTNFINDSMKASSKGIGGIPGHILVMTLAILSSNLT